MRDQQKFGCLTRGVHDRQHDGGDPCDLTVAGVEDDLDVLEEDRDGLGEGVRETDGDEGSEDHGPAPAAVWRGHGGGTDGLGWHRGPTSRQKRLCKTQKVELKVKVRTGDIFSSLKVVKEPEPPLRRSQKSDGCRQFREESGDGCSCY